MKKSLLIMLLSLVVNVLSAEITICKRLSEILPHVEKDTLVVFNINNVLTISKQDAGSTPWAEEQIASLMKQMNTTKPHATNLFIPFWHAVLIASDVELYDPEAEALVAYLQRHGIKVMALTNRYIEMAYPTHHNLRSVGIDFARNPPCAEDIPITGVSSPAKYVEGILFNGLINFKGDTLAAFLQQIGYHPGKVIYVEDKPKHLAQVGEKIEALGIRFLGIHFGAMELERQVYQPELAAVQVKYHLDILDDSAALILRHGQTGCKKALEVAGPHKPLPVKNPHIKAILSLEELQGELKPGTLVVTELDQVLWETQGSIGSRPFHQHMFEKYLTFGECPLKARDRADRLFEKIQRRAQVRLLIDSKFFHQIPQKNCWSVAVTHRPHNLIQRTMEQAESVGLHFHSPFKEEKSHLPTGILCREGSESQFHLLDKKLASLSQQPARIIAISSDSEDLVQVEKIASHYKIPFRGRLLFPKSQGVMLDDEILAIELYHLDHLLTNDEAAQILHYAESNVD
ncbi:MAG: DUF2608 domain-containing protein [Parachlamydia sp.]|nr:DUF2608 domain-containing protein [Parachlamydia sp.]